MAVVDAMVNDFYAVLLPPLSGVSVLFSCYVILLSRAVLKFQI